MLIESDRLLEDEICLSDQFVLTRLCYVVFFALYVVFYKLNTRFRVYFL